MLEDLQIRHYSPTTIRIPTFSAFLIWRDLALLGPAPIS